MLALLSHGLAVLAPIVLWLERSLLGGSDRAPMARRLYIGSASMIALAVGLALAGAGLSVKYRFEAEPWWLLSASAARYVWQHAFMWLLPAGRFGVLLSDQPAQHLIASALAWVALIAACAWIWEMRARDPVLAFGLAWFLITLAPVANLVPLGNTPIAMHYLYLPSVGLALALVRAASALAERLPRQRAAVARALPWVMAVGLALYWLPASARAVRAWGDDEQLFAESSANYPNEIEPLVNLISAQLSRQRYEQAAASLARGRELAPENLGVVRNEFSLLWQTGQLEAAVALLDRHPGLAARPDFQLGRGQALFRLGRPAEAAVSLQRAFDSRSRISERLRVGAGAQLLAALVQSGRHAEAQRRSIGCSPSIRSVKTCARWSACGARPDHGQAFWRASS